MARGEKVTANDEELANATGKSTDEWIQILQDLDFDCRNRTAVVQHLMDEYELQMYWAHCISHKYCG
ncbi:hypothetical protein J7J84_04250 [bacterium]|nr:hypothetical protein [bacterium]